MSIQKTEEILMKFLKNPDPQVLVLKGEWGVGKTYFLEHFLEENKNNHAFQFKKYAYISLFGLPSIEEFKQAIVRNRINREDIGSTKVLIMDNLKNPGKISGSLGKVRKVTDPIGSIPIIKEFYNPIVDTITGALSLFSITPSEYLICVDDFERKGIDGQDLLGVISDLKTKRKCKIILIFNDEKLDGEEKKKYEEFREKVIDIEVKYAPTPEECSKLVFKEWGVLNSNNEIIHNFVMNLGIRNIRILKKIETLHKLLIPLLGEYEEGTKRQAWSTLCLLTLSYYSRGNPEIPTIDYLCDLQPGWMISVEGGNIVENNAPGTQLLRSYGYTSTDAFDKEIYNVIDRGYVDHESFKREADLKNEEFIIGSIANKYEEVWHKYFHSAFQNNEEDFIGALKEVFFSDEGGKKIDISSLNGTVRILRELSKSEVITEIIDEYIRQNAEDNSKFNISIISNHLFHPLDEEIKTKFVEKYNSSLVIRTLKETLDFIIENKYNYGMDEESVLFASTEEDIYSLLKSVNEYGLTRKYCIALLKYQNSSSASSEWQALTQRTLKVLERIGGESVINQLRVNAYIKN